MFLGRFLKTSVDRILLNHRAACNPHSFTTQKWIQDINGLKAHVLPLREQINIISRTQTLENERLSSRRGVNWSLCVQAVAESTSCCGDGLRPHSDASITRWNPLNNFSTVVNLIHNWSLISNNACYTWELKRPSSAGKWPGSAINIHYMSDVINHHGRSTLTVPLCMNSICFQWHTISFCSAVYTAKIHSNTAAEILTISKWLKRLLIKMLNLGGAEELVQLSSHTQLT